MGQLPFHLQSALQKPDAEAQLWQWQVWVPQQNRYHSGSGGSPTCDHTCNQTINVKKNQLITSNNYTSNILIHIHTWTCRMPTMSPQKKKPQARWIINFQGPSRAHWLGSTFCRPFDQIWSNHLQADAHVMSRIIQRSRNDPGQWMTVVLHTGWLDLLHCGS